jgi:hypothetical protein
VWVFFLIIPNPKLRESFFYLQLLGFILLVLGTLVYNEILVIPFWKFDKNTKVAVEKRRREHAGKG